MSLAQDLLKAAGMGVDLSPKKPYGSQCAEREAAVIDRRIARRKAYIMKNHERMPVSKMAQSLCMNRKDLIEFAEEVCDLKLSNKSVWTDWRNETLIRMHSENCGMYEISLALGVTENAARKQIYNLGLSLAHIKSRPVRLDDNGKKRACDMRISGMPVKVISAELGVSNATLVKLFQREGLTNKDRSKPWRASEVTNLLYAIENGIDRKILAFCMGRTIASINSMYKRVMNDEEMKEAYYFGHTATVSRDEFETLYRSMNNG